VTSQTISFFSHPPLVPAATQLPSFAFAPTFFIEISSAMFSLPNPPFGAGSFSFSEIPLRICFLKAFTTFQQLPPRPDPIPILPSLRDSPRALYFFFSVGVIVVSKTVLFREILGSVQRGVVFFCGGVACWSSVSFPFYPGVWIYYGFLHYSVFYSLFFSVDSLF